LRLVVRCGAQLGTRPDCIRFNAGSDKDGNRMSPRKAAPGHPRGGVETEALEPQRWRCVCAAGLDQFEVVTDVQDTVLDDTHDDGSPPSDLEGGFNMEQERQVVIRRGHELILPPLIPYRQMTT